METVLGAFREGNEAFARLVGLRDEELVAELLKLDKDALRQIVLAGVLAEQFARERR